MNTKICRKCRAVKDLELFDNYYRSKDGKKSYCKECEKEYNRARYERKREVIKNQVRAWQAANPEKLKEYEEKFSEKMRRRADERKTSETK